MINQHLSNSKESQEQYVTEESLDPTLQGGYKVAYDKQIPVQVRNQTTGRSISMPGSQEMLRFRILVLANQHPYSDIKIEITCESDLFFQFISHIDQVAFKRIKKEQMLNIGYEQLVQMTVKLMNLADKQPNNYFAVLFIKKNKQAHIDFIQNMEYKFIQVLTLQFKQVEQFANRQSVSHRFNLTKNRMNLLQGRLNDVLKMIKLKNPSIWQGLHKSKPINKGGTSENTLKKTMLTTNNFHSTSKSNK